MYFFLHAMSNTILFTNWFSNDYDFQYLSKFSVNCPPTPKTLLFQFFCENKHLQELAYIRGALLVPEAYGTFL